MLFDDEDSQETTVVVKKAPPKQAASNPSVEIQALGQAILEIVKNREIPEPITDWDIEVTERDPATGRMKRLRLTAIQ